MSFRDDVGMVLNSAEFISTLLGNKPTAIHPLAGGSVSTVYRAQMPNGAVVVLKFSENAEELYFEQQFLAAWSEKGIRTPTIIKHARLPENIGGGVLVMDFVPGHNLLQLMETTHTVDEVGIMTDLGRLLATMHQVTTIGFGFPTIDKADQIVGVYETLKDSLQTPYWQNEIAANLENRDLTQDELVLFDAAAQILSNHLGQAEGCFIHGDFRAGNILYAEALAQPYTIIDPHPQISHPYLCLTYTLILSEIYDRPDHATMIKQGYHAVSSINEDALHAARFLKAVELLPRWGQPDNKIAQPLRKVLKQEKAWLNQNV